MTISLKSSKVITAYFLDNGFLLDGRDYPLSEARKLRDYLVKNLVDLPHADEPTA